MRCGRKKLLCLWLYTCALRAAAVPLENFQVASLLEQQLNAQGKYHSRSAFQRNRFRVAADSDERPTEVASGPAQRGRFGDSRGFVAVGETSQPFGEVNAQVKKKTKRCMRCLLYFYPRQHMVLVRATMLTAMRRASSPPQEQFIKRGEWYSNQMKDTAARSQEISQRNPKSIETTSPVSEGATPPSVELNLDGFPQPAGDPVELLSIVACLNERSPTITEAIVNAALGGFSTFALCSDLNSPQPVPSSSYPIYDPLQKPPTHSAERPAQSVQAAAAP